MAVQPQDAVHQFGAETVHHRHDDDQGRHTERDAHQREPAMTEMKPSARRARRYRTAIIHSKALNMVRFPVCVCGSA